MKAGTTYPVLQTPGTVTWWTASAAPFSKPKPAARPSHQAVCYECRYAELYAEQPRARCRCAASVHARQVVFAGQPGCALMTPRDEKDLTLAWCSPGLKSGHARFVQLRPRAH